jgi:pantoate--beta-alanine ligase
MSDLAKTARDVRRAVGAAHAERKSIGFVPTLGALHDGHLALFERARQQCGYVVVSIFVNPTQFPPGTDFESYPRDLDGDVKKVEGAGVDLVFSPSVVEIYPPGDHTSVEVTGPLAECLCGPHRPGHFRGVTTVCARLFNIVQPDRAYFGEKDHQQLLIIKQMVRDLRFPLEIVSVPTVREPDGLAMSSRNAYLSSEERRAAVVLPRALFAARDLLNAGERSAAAVLATAREVIDSESLVSLQYLELRDAETLREIHAVEQAAVLALAAHVGPARLIDSILLTPTDY